MCIESTYLKTSHFKKIEAPNVTVKMIQYKAFIRLSISRVEFVKF